MTFVQGTQNSEVVGDSEEEDSEDDSEISEGFVLESGVPDAVLPDLTEEFSSLLGKVRAVVKFFREIL
jgi:hypothetical protein